MMDRASLSALCYIWANAFGILDNMKEYCEKNKCGIRAALDHVGLGLDDKTIADIYELDFDYEDFSVNNFGCCYFPNHEVGDIVTYSDILSVEREYKLIDQYVEDNYFKD